MSYIRSISNPEGLYIWGGTQGIEISVGSDPLLTIPRHIFRGVLKRWYRYGENVSYRGARMSQTPDFKYQLEYKDWEGRSVKAYDVTWTYIVTQNHIDINKVR